MVSIRKLAGGGDLAHEQMIGIANSLGVDVIELLWLPRNRLPFYGIPSVSGYKKPVVDRSTISTFDDIGEGSTSWIDCTVSFYPDENGFCYGLVYDCETNRDLLASSLSTNWFKIVDKRVRDEIIELAKEKGYDTDIKHLTDVKIKKSKEEIDAIAKAKRLEDQLEELKMKMSILEKERSRVEDIKEKNKKIRLDGIKLPIVDIEPIKD